MSTTRRLILLRHAKSDYPAGVADLDRPLDERGRADAPRVGAYLAAEGLIPDLALVSPARRTAQTWTGVSAPLEGARMETVPSLYDAPARRILDAVHGVPAKVTSLMVIGHNPGLADLAILLASKGSREARAAMRKKFPTAALAVIDFEAEGWDALDTKGGVLDRFVTPRTLGLRADE